MKMREVILILFMLVFVNNIFAQISTKKDLLGVWHSNNTDSLYYKSNKVVLISDITYLASNKICNTISWEITKCRFNIRLYDHCKFPDNIFKIKGKERLRIKKNKIILYRGWKKIDSFIIQSMIILSEGVNKLTLQRSLLSSSS